jgi:hypothetical protein
MSGVKVPAAVLGTTVIGSHVVKGTLPFTGLALGAYLAIGFALVLAGIVLRITANARS